MVVVIINKGLGLNVFGVITIGFNNYNNYRVYIIYLIRIKGYIGQILYARDYLFFVVKGDRKNMGYGF